MLITDCVAHDFSPDYFGSQLIHLLLWQQDHHLLLLLALPNGLLFSVTWIVLFHFFIPSIRPTVLIRTWFWNKSKNDMCYLYVPCTFLDCGTFIGKIENNHCLVVFICYNQNIQRHSTMDNPLSLYSKNIIKTMSQSMQRRHFKQAESLYLICLRLV